MKLLREGTSMRSSEIEFVLHQSSTAHAASLIEFGIFRITGTFSLQSIRLQLTPCGCRNVDCLPPMSKKLPSKQSITRISRQQHYSASFRRLSSTVSERTRYYSAEGRISDTRSWYEIPVITRPMWAKRKGRSSEPRNASLETEIIIY